MLISVIPSPQNKDSILITIIFPPPNHFHPILVGTKRGFKWQRECQYSNLKTMDSTIIQLYLRVSPSHCTQTCIGSVDYHFNDPENAVFDINIHIIKQSPPPRLSVCLLTINSKTTARIFIRFSPIDRVILQKNTGK